MTSPMPPPGTLPKRPATPEEAAALSSALRLRILRITYRNPMTNKEIAERLGRDPATTLYHVRKLVDTGFLQALPVRRGTRGSREIPYEATGRSWGLDPAFGEDERVGSQAMLEAFLAEVAEVGFERLYQSRLALRLPEEDIEELNERLAGLLNEFAARPPRSGSPLFGVYVARYGPDPSGE